MGGGADGARAHDGDGELTRTRVPGDPGGKGTLGGRWRQEREDDGDRRRERDSEDWFLGPDLRDHGSIHSDTWSKSAAELATRNKIAVFPVVGWWREQLKLGRSERKARFSLVVSIETPPTGIDIYAPVEAQIRVMVPTVITTPV